MRGWLAEHHVRSEGGDALLRLHHVLERLRGGALRGLDPAGVGLPPLREVHVEDHAAAEAAAAAAAAKLLLDARRRVRSGVRL